MTIHRIAVLALGVEREMLSTAELRPSSPRPKARLARVTAETWGGPDYQRGLSGPEGGR